tara:strand:+ start:202 stop:501 length:300 start_codon:yes stop_codon:yes gene_type:complete
MTLKKHQNPKGGLNQAGRDHFKRTEGSNLKAPVKDTPSKESDRFWRKVSFACRFGGMDGPEKDEKGRPTPLKKALRVWGFRNKASARAFCNKHKGTRKT